MKNFVFALLLTVASATLFAKNNTQTTASDLKEVTVYRSQARLVQEANYSIPSGTTEVTIEGISTSINPATLQVFIKGKAELISASYNTNYFSNATQSPQEKRWLDSLELLGDKINLLNAEKQVYSEELDLLKSNKSLSNDKTTFTATDVENLANMYRRRALEIKQKMLALDKNIKEQTEAKDRVQKQLNEFNTVKNRPTGQIVLTLYSTQPTTGAVRCAYSITGAGWAPQYDLRSEGLNQPITLVQKADVYQSSGIDWEHVKLTISTGNPAQNNNRPILNPLYVNFVEYRVTTSAYKTMDMKRYGYENPAPSMNLALEEGKKEDRFDEVTTQAINVEDNTVSVSYELQLPQDVPTDGKAHTIQYDKQDIPATYIYHTVPRLDPAAFLLAKIVDWGKYNLMAGTANIFFEGAYVGQSAINPNVTSDTLLLSFGRDERITVKRNKITDLCETKCIGSNKTDKYVYDIVIKNTKQQPIDIEVLDQLPVSKQSDIKVELEEGSGAQYNSEIGKLEWKFTIAPQQSQKTRFIYSVKYPKNKQVYESNY